MIRPSYVFRMGENTEHRAQNTDAGIGPVLTVNCELLTVDPLIGMATAPVGHHGCDLP